MITALNNTKTQQAIKTAIAAVLATWITLYFHMPHPFWAPAIVIMLMDEHLEGSLKKGIARILGTILGAGIAYFIGHFTVDSQPLYYCITFIIVSITIYGFLLGNSIWLVFGVTYLFLSMYLVMDPTGSLTIAAWRSSEMITGVVSWVIVSLLVFPSHLGKDVIQTSEQLLMDSKTLINQLHQSITDGTTLSWEKDKQDFKTRLGILKGYLDILGNTGSQGQTKQRLEVLIEHGWTWWRQCGQLYQSLAKDHPLNAQLHELFITVSALLDQWDTCLKAHQPLSPSLDTLLVDIEHLMVDLAQTPQKGSVTLMQTWLSALQNWLSTFEQFINQESIVTITSYKKSWKEFSHDWLVKLMSKRSFIPHCLSIALGCCLVVYVWLLTGWPGGICAGISALVVGADSNLTKINLKIRLRLMGSLVGGTVGLLVFIFLVHSIFSMLAWVFIGVAILAYFSLKNFSYMYFCWMAAMGYVITLVPSLQHTPEMSFTFERIFGLIMGLIVMAFVVNFFWPLNPKKQLQDICDNIHIKLAICWHILSETNSDNLQQQRARLNAVQVHMMGLISDGIGIAKPNGMMKTLKPITELVLAQQWCSNYLTQGCLETFESLENNQWQTLCKQTRVAVTSQSKETINDTQKSWQQLSNELKADTDIAQSIAGQCWLTLQANSRFLDALAGV